MRCSVVTDLSSGDTVIIDGGYDLLTSEGTLTGDTTALGKTILKFKEILNL